MTLGTDDLSRLPRLTKEAPVRRRSARTISLRSLVAAGATAALLAAGLPATAQAADDPVFISEIHYDNVGADTGEAIEVQAPAGTNLSGWSLVLYNGSGGGTYGSAAPLPSPVPDSGVVVVTYPTDGIQNGSPDGVALINASGAVVEFLSYEGTFTATNGPASGMTSVDIGVSEPASTPVGHSLQKISGTWNAPAANTFGVRNSGGTDPDPDPEPEPDPEEVLISAVQGSGASSPMVGADVIIDGIVTSLFTSNDAPDGFFLQEEDADRDDDPATSEGVFVFCRGECPAEGDLSVGDRVTARGLVNEYFGMTQVSTNVTNGSITVVSEGNPLPTPVPISLPASGSTKNAATFEATEGMVVTIPGTLAVSEYFELARYGQLVLTAGERPYQFTHSTTPSASGYAAFVADLDTRRIILDDDNNTQNDAVLGPDNNEPYPWPQGGLSLDNKVRGGDTITGLTAVMHWSFAGQSGTDAWRLRPIDGVDYTFTSVNPEPEQPEDVGGRLTVVSYNVLNYFATVDTTTSTSSGPCGPSGTMDCRGADSEQERTRQLAKIAAGLSQIDADVAGLLEIENDEGLATQQIVDALNLLQGPGTYAAVETGYIGTDAIKTALIYQPATVTPVGDYALLDSSVDPRFLDHRNRPVLIQTFEENATGERFTIAVNHLKSKGSSCASDGDPDRADGQGNCAGVRTAAAEALADYLLTDPTGSGDEDFLIVGDLNSYAKEDPIMALAAAGYTDLHAEFEGGLGYSYVFDGQLGYLDTALANDSLLGQVTGATSWHINADEIPLFDYNDDVFDAGEANFDRESNARPLYAPDALRSSDHDPVIVGLTLGDPAERIAAVRAMLTTMQIQGGVRTALDGKLRAALVDLEKGDVQRACGRLTDFINQTRALPTKHLSASDAAVLRRQAEQIQVMLGC